MAFVDESITEDGLANYSSIEFVAPLDDRFRCPVCKNPLKEPQQTICGHRICLGCLNLLFRRTPNPVCPVDKEASTLDGVFKDVCCKREILCLFCFCTNRGLGCEWKKELQYLEDHLKTCEYTGIACTNPGCRAIVAKAKLLEHLQTCAFRPSDCQHCLQKVPAAEMENHFQECTRFPLTCPGCGLENIPRDELELHQRDICDQAEIPCQFSKFGCNFKGPREALQQHYKDQTEVHLNLVADTLQKSGGKDPEILELIRKMSDEIKKLQNQMLEQREALAISNQNQRAYQGKLSLVEKTVGEHRREITDMKQRTQGASCQASNSDQMAMQLEEISSAFRDQERRLSTVEAGRVVSASGSRSMAVAPMALERRQDRNEHQLALHDIQLAEHDLKLQMLEATSYDGTYIWKIDEYTRRYQEGVSGKTPSIYSPPFYVGRYGYKVCARVYANGDGMGKGTHLSLFFVIMKGEYDALLSWPFRSKVTFKLLDHDRQHDVGDTFRPDPSSSSFKRPTTNMNIASGCPLFISHQNLQSRSYIKDDTMFIKISVEMTGLPPPLV